jgi:hypothetical protein
MFVVSKDKAAISFRSTHGQILLEQDRECPSRKFARVPNSLDLKDKNYMEMNQVNFSHAS